MACGTPIIGVCLVCLVLLGISVNSDAISSVCVCFSVTVGGN